LLVSALTLTACSGAGDDQGAQAQDQALTLGAQLDNNSFDTADLEIGNRTQFWQPVYDTLLTLSPDAEVEAGLAEGWEYNEDNTVLTLELRDDVTFSDGEPFNGEAVKTNIEHVKGGTGQNAFMAAAIEEVVVNSDTEVELHLTAPNPAQLDYLAWVGGVMASPAAIEAGTLNTTPIGSGPYVYDGAASTPGTSYVYTRRDGYWNEDAYPYDKVEVRVLTDINARLNALKSGQIDGGLVTQQTAKEAEASGLTLTTLAINWSGILIGDRAGSMVPALADTRVRQAINMALDGDALVATVASGYGTPTDQVFNTQSQAFVPGLENAYEYDPAAAQDLLAEAGYPDGFSVTMPLLPGTESAMALYTQQLADIGITVKTELLAASSVIPDLLSAKYPMFVIPLSSASAWQDIQTWIAPDAPWNMFKSSDPELDVLIAAVQAETDPAAQDAAFAEIGTWLVDNAWFAPVMRPDNVFASRDGLNVVMQAQNSVPSLSGYSPAN
jgi:peptide/nickel transport system substrate-binding protein